jgi:hypothetical protein
MSKNIKNIVKKNLDKLFEIDEVAFGVMPMDKLSDEEKGQFGGMETIQTEKGIDLGKPSVEPALNQVHKEDKKEEDAYFKELDKKMGTFQKTDNSEESQIGEAFEAPKVDREDDQESPEDIYDVEALGTGMQALKYDDEDTDVYDKFEERMKDLNGDDETYEILQKNSDKYKKYRWDKPDEYNKPPKLRVTDESYKKYSDVIKENIFKTKGKIKSIEQVLKVVDKVPSRVKVDETVFAITDGENYYRLIWEGHEDGEAVITHDKNVNVVSESVGRMKHLWDFKSSDSISTKKNITESEDMFKKMFSQVKKGILTENKYKAMMGDPTFGGMTLVFDSDVDKALYIVNNPTTKSKAEPEFLRWLSSLGYTQEQMADEGEKIKKIIKQKVESNPNFPGYAGGTWTQMTGEINIPSTWRSEM